MAKSARIINHQSGGDSNAPYLEIDSKLKVDGSFEAGGAAKAKVNGEEGVLIGLPIGSIVMWSGTDDNAMIPNSNIPSGWKVCDGSELNIPIFNNGTSADFDFKYTHSGPGGGTTEYYKTTQEEYRPLLKIIGATYGYTQVEGWTQIKVKLPDLKGRFPIGVGTGTDSNNNTLPISLNSKGGEYTHKLLSSESGLPAHKHNIQTSEGAGAGNYVDSAPSGQQSNLYTDNNDAMDATNYHNNTPPYIGLNFIIKCL